jgi:hypothetical protein
VSGELDATAVEGLCILATPFPVVWREERVRYLHLGQSKVRNEVSNIREVLSFCGGIFTLRSRDLVVVPNHRLFPVSPSQLT